MSTVEEVPGWGRHDEMKGRILFIDDDQAGREVALFNLRKAGYEVTQSSDGLEGLSLFS
ncbi:MAG: hypothetical protein H6Q84_2351, partial [Deltaproteobacteria bacterium]|nr:hypothetical protein [Deltaproteobacteria bacterium]